MGILAEIMSLAYLLIIVISFFMIGRCAITNYQPGPYGCIEYKIVKEVGGCDRGGYCGVLTDDGTYTDALKPVPGMRICTKRRYMFKD